MPNDRERQRARLRNLRRVRPLGRTGTEAAPDAPGRSLEHQPRHDEPGPRDDAAAGPLVIGGAEDAPLGRQIAPALNWEAISRSARDQRRWLRLDPCAYCGERVAGRMTIDHIRAKLRRGPNHWTNLAAACDRCNNKKHGMRLLPWLLRRFGVQRPP